MSKKAIKRIIYIDDSTDEFFLSRMLFKAERVNIDLDCYPDVDVFLAQVSGEKENALDDAIVVLDLNLTVIKGTEGVSLIRKEVFGREAIIGICTGSDDPADMKLADEAGADFYVTKPLDRSSLLEICESTAALCYTVSPDGVTMVERYANGAA